MIFTTVEKKGAAFKKKSLKIQEKIVLNQHKNDGNRKKTWQIMQNKWNTSVEFRVVCANS